MIKPEPLGNIDKTKLEPEGGKPKVIPDLTEGGNPALGLHRDLGHGPQDATAGDRRSR